MTVAVLLSILLAVLVLFLLFQCLYRVCLSPIAGFPGPKLAALTFWYEFYYDVCLKGRYTWKIKELHEKYGPIIRINPEEIHIDDPAFYEQLYVGPSRRTDKWHWSAKMFGTTAAAVGTTDHDLHRQRRAALNPYFSTKCVTRLEPTIQSEVNTLCRKLRYLSGSGKAVNLADAFTCLSADVIGAYAFGQQYEFLGRPNFAPEWRALMMDLSRSTHLMKQFGWLYKISTAIPESILAMLHPISQGLLRLRRDISTQIESIRQSKGIDRETVFHGLLESSLPDHEKVTQRLTDEGLTIIGAGTVTTGHTLSVIFFHVLSRPSLLSKLREELRAALNESETLTRDKLTQLPYISAIINEGLRLSFGVSHRLQRISPDTPLHYGGWVIPAGTPVSQTQMFIMQDPTFFPHPDEFIPERWLDHPVPADVGQGLALPEAREAKKYLVPFSRGTRACLGMNLAYAELFLTLGTLLRPVDMGGLEMELFETEAMDMSVAHDFFNPSPPLSSEGLRVLVR